MIKKVVSILAGLILAVGIAAAGPAQVASADNNVWIVKNSKKAATRVTVEMYSTKTEKYLYSRTVEVGASYWSKPDEYVRYFYLPGGYNAAVCDSTDSYGNCTGSYKYNYYDTGSHYIRWDADNVVTLYLYRQP